jgi:hypothetical protein
LIGAGFAAGDGRGAEVNATGGGEMTVGSEMRAGVGSSAGTETGAAAATGEDAIWDTAAGAGMGGGAMVSLCGMCATAAVMGMTVPKLGSESDSTLSSVAGDTARSALRFLEVGP